MVCLNRGNLNEQKTGISGMPTRQEDSTLDPTGNWTDYVQKNSGTTALDQDHTHNKVNQTTDITETVGTAWVTRVYDKAVSMTTAAKPSSLADGLTLKYHAWNRLVEAKDDTGVIGEYELSVGA